MFKRKIIPPDIPSFIIRLIESHHQIYIPVSGYSMLPFLGPGDLVCIQKLTESEYLPGDIIIYKLNGKLIAHRIIDKYLADSQNHYKCKGDSAVFPDSPIREPEILAKVVRVIKTKNKCFTKWFCLRF